MTIPVGYRLVAHCVALVCILVVSLATSPALAAPKASLVMDMRDGRVLYARSADRKLHPASLTKMMTLYLTFDAVRKGKIRLDQKVRVSRKASRMPASKLYLRKGQRVTIRSLIRATAIKSANDAAMVLAETVGGSQRRFGEMMTRTAKRLGMKNTRLKNPHGLTQRGHYSTARDMAILARHLFHDFPEYYHIFARKQSVAAGRRIWSTNRLLSTYPGADGIKTGYTRAAGYNLVASARRGKKRIIAVAFGEASNARRARRVSQLLDIGFSKAKPSVRRKKPGKVAPRKQRKEATPQSRVAAVRRAPKPVARPTMRNAVMAALGEVLSSDAQAADVSTRTRAKRRKAAPARSRSAAPRFAELPMPRGAKRRPVLAKAVTRRPAAKPGAAVAGIARGIAHGIRTAPRPRRKPTKLAARARRSG